MLRNPHVQVGPRDHGAGDDQAEVVSEVGQRRIRKGVIDETQCLIVYGACCVDQPCVGERVLE